MNRVDILTGNSTRRPSDSIWGNCPIHDITRGKVNGYFGNLNFGDFKESANVNAAEASWGQNLLLFGSDGASATLLDATGGGLTVLSDGDNEGIGLRTQNVPFQISRSHYELWWELCLQTSTVADTKHGFFAGLTADVAITATSPIAAAGTLADINLVGFHRLEGDGDQIDTVYKADGVTQVTVDTDALDGTVSEGQTIPSLLSAATDFKLGMRFVPSGDRAGNYRLLFYYNGIRLSESKEIPSAAGTDFPNDVRLGFVFSLLNATGSTPGSCALKWAQFAQIYEPMP